MSQPAKNDSAGLVFDLTRWDLIRLARHEGDGDYARRQAARALNQLCEIYRAPVLAYLNRRVASPHDAEDLAQEFFSRRICPALILNAEAERGRFRALLLVSLKNFLRDQIAYEHAQKRGGNVKFVPLQEADASANGTTATADRCFDTCWAKTVVDRALTQLKRTLRARGEMQTYEALVPFISDPAVRTAMQDTARRLGINVKTLHVRLSRLRALYAKCVREELARTVTSPDEIEPEIRYLLDILSTAS